MNVKNQLRDGLFFQNPVTVQLLGMCSVMAITTTLFNGLGMGVSVLVILTLANIIISILRKIIPNNIRIACFIVVIAGFVTIVDLCLQAFLPDLSSSLGLFIPLIVVNCIILGRAEAFAYKNGPAASAMDGIFQGLGYTMVLVIMCVVREFLGNGTFGGGLLNGGDGIRSLDHVAISGGTVKSNGGSGNLSGGNGIISYDIDLSGSLELTAKAGSPNGKALSQRGNELELDTIKDKLGPGAKVTATDADGKVIDQVPIPRPVEPEESSSSSDGGSAAPSAPASPLPGLTVTDKDGQRISYTSTQSGNTLTVCVGRFTASFRISLAALRQLRAEGIETITFQTILCSTTLSVDELLAMGGEDAEAVLTHRLTDSSLTVG